MVRRIKKIKMYEMELEEAIRYIHENPQVYLTATGKVGGGYICPICGSGNGSHKTGIMPDKNECWKFTCFANSCFPPKSDIINIIGAKENLDNKAALFRAFEIYGITLKKNSNYNLNQQQTSRTQEKIIKGNFEQEIFLIKEDIKNSVENLWQAQDYLRSRGISIKTADKLNCGFILNWYHPKILIKYNGKPPFAGSPRLVIPTSEKSYLARDIRPSEEISAEEKNFVKQKAGDAKFLNLEKISDAKSSIFIVEGEL